MKKKEITPLVAREYLIPFILLTSLFFMWGAARSVMDVLNKHFQLSLGVTHTHAAMMQTVIYSAYFLMAIPGGRMIRRYGTRNGIVAGLLLFGLGALLFIPSETIGSFNYILFPLFVIGCGLVILETAANPYATLLGAPETAAGRLNRAQSFNGLGSICGALFGGLFFFQGTEDTANIAIPYSVIGIIVLIVAYCFTRIRLPEVHTPQPATPSQASEKKLNGIFFFGFLALLCYEIAEISINTFFINYVSDDGFMSPLQASLMLSFGGLGLFMCGRFAGSSLMRKVPAERILYVCSIGTLVTTMAVIGNWGLFSVCSLILCYVFESIMFPTIFALTIKQVDPSLTEKASSVLMMTVIGGAIGPLLMGYMADHLSVPIAFMVPCLAFLVVYVFAFTLVRRK